MSMVLPPSCVMKGRSCGSINYSESPLTSSLVHKPLQMALPLVAGSVYRTEDSS
jgi:hypothetical protein